MVLMWKDQTILAVALQLLYNNEVVGCLLLLPWLSVAPCIPRVIKINECYCGCMPDFFEYCYLTESMIRTIARGLKFV